MSTRFSKYQNSVLKFINDRSSISEYECKDIIMDLIKNSDFILPITLLTVMKNIGIKNKLTTTIHGYDMATGIELLCILLNILENPTYIDGNKKDILLPLLPTYINLSLSNNLNMLLHHIGDNKGKDILLINRYTYLQLNDKMVAMITKISQYKLDLKNYYTNNGVPNNLFKFHFTHSSSKGKLQKIKVLPKDKLLNYINDTTGIVCQLALILGWILGFGDYQMVSSLERLGYHLGLIIKLSHDFSTLEQDLDCLSSTNTTTNYILNFGFSDAFALFSESKEKFNEGLLTLGIHTPTIKEFIDILERKVDISVDQSSPDLKST